MSRRAPPTAAQERAAANQQTIKTLLKLESNKSCADCKRNKHPRWASWNLGVFVCIRCSGIHRGMGTHISRVKSVDLDAWTDEQLQSVLRWGNARANKYWESKLAEGHVPSEAKIENFIRTKYESKRWVMDGPMPDPASLDADGDDDVPLNVVQEKAKLDRASSQRNSSTSSQPVPPPPKKSQPIDLFGDVPEPSARPSTTDTPGTRAPPPKTATAPKPTKASDSLLGLDFFGGPPAATSARPSSTASTPAGSTLPSRPDLKQSILSLYASAPKPQPSTQHDRQGSFGGMQSPPAQQSSLGGLDDAFGGLGFNSTASPPAANPPRPAQSDPFASFSNPMPQRSSVAPPQVTSPPLSGGGFFDPGPKSTAKPSTASKAPQPILPQASPLDSNDFGDFSFASEPSAPPKPTTTAKNATLDLFDMNDPPAPAPVPKQAPPPQSSINLKSAFNLSSPAPTPQPAPKPAPAAQRSASNFGGMSSSDPWGTNEWATPDPTPPQPSKPQVAPAPATKAPPMPLANDFSAWGGSDTATGQSSFGAGSGSTPKAPPKVTPDEDFGGWSSAAPVSPAASKAPQAPASSSKPAGGGFGGGDDLFSNVWE